MVLRQPIYEKDRMDPVDPAARLSLDPAQLQRFPEGYRHLAYLQTEIGFKVKPDMPGLKGAAGGGALCQGTRLARRQVPLKLRSRSAMMASIAPNRRYEETPQSWSPSPFSTTTRTSP